MVKASITGAMLGNMLLVLGAAVLAGGARREKQTFNATAALSGSAMMFLALTAMSVPDFFHVVRGDAALRVLRAMSIGISVVLLLIYAPLAALLAADARAHLRRRGGRGARGAAPVVAAKAAVVLLLATAGVVVTAELLVAAIEAAIESFGLTHTFIGVIVIAIVGNAAEHFTAIPMAMKNKMDLAFNIAFESSKQVALFVAPVLVLLSIPLGQPLTLEFTHMEVFGMAVGVGASDADRARRRVELARGGDAAGRLRHPRGGLLLPVNEPEPDENVAVPRARAEPW